MRISHQAFAITQDDVRMVLLEMGLPASDSEVTRWTDALDHPAITRAASDCSDDLDEQAFGAMNAVRDQILLATQAQRTAEIREGRTLAEASSQEDHKRPRRRSRPLMGCAWNGSPLFRFMCCPVSKDTGHVLRRMRDLSSLTLLSADD